VHRPATLLVAATLVLGASAIPADGAGALSNGPLAFIATDSGTTQVFTVNPDASGLTKVTDRPGGAGEYGLSWSPDASSLLVVLSTSRDLIYAMRPDGTGLRRLSSSCTARCLGDDSPAFTRSGRRIAFERAFGPIKNENAAVVSIDTMDADGTHVKQVTQKTVPTSTEDHAPTWSPDGRRIAFQRTNTIASPPGRSAIYVMDANGTHVRRVTPLAFDASNPRWSRDGTRILFNDVAESSPGKDANIYTVRVDGTGLTRLTHYTGGSAQAFVDDWSPDGTKIVFHFLDTRIDDLYVMDADGANAHRLTRLGPGADPRRAVWGTAP
jgi:Tol biopolymer transport system component